MKTLIVHFMKDLGGGRIEIAGRCCEAPILLNDVLVVKGNDTSSLQVVSIDVYGKQVECLHTGYVGTLVMQQGNPATFLMTLVDEPSDKQ